MNKRPFNRVDIRDIRLLLFGKYGRGMFEVRTSPKAHADAEGYCEYTADSRQWDDNGDCDFPVDSTRLTSEYVRHWPDCYEGIVLDLYVRQPDAYVGMNAIRDDWQMGNESITMKDGKWVYYRNAGGAE
tara:strand:+ start:7759 stop:8145 length:387 start_codon:yes stop_codon:yes gene_type:complete